jgi:hypothetical protein
MKKFLSLIVIMLVTATVSAMMYSIIHRAVVDEHANWKITTVFSKTVDKQVSGSPR